MDERNIIRIALTVDRESQSLVAIGQRGKSSYCSGIGVVIVATLLFTTIVNTVFVI